MAGTGVSDAPALAQLAGGHRLVARDRRANRSVGTPEAVMRLVLLAVVAAGAGAYAWQYLYQAIDVDIPRARVQLCTWASLTDAAPPYRTAQARCWAETVAQPQALVITAGVLVTAVVAVAICAVAPQLPWTAGRVAALTVATWWSLLLTVLLPLATVALVARDQSTAMAMAKLCCVLILTRPLTRPRPRSAPGTSWWDLVALAAACSWAVPAVAFWVQQLTYGRWTSALGYAAPGWLGAAGVGGCLWALSWRDAITQRMTAPQSRPILPGVAALGVGFAIGILLGPSPREGGLADPHTAAQWASFAVLAMVGAALVLNLARGLAHSFTARIRTPLTRGLFNAGGMIVVTLVAALALDLGRTFLLLCRPDLQLGEVAMLAFVRFVVMPATWIAMVTAVTVLILGLRQPLSWGRTDPSAVARAR